MVLGADEMIYSTASRATMRVPNPRDIEWTAGMISRVPVETNAEKGITRVKKACTTTTKAGEGEVINWKSWRF